MWKYVGVVVFGAIALFIIYTGTTDQNSTTESVYTTVLTRDGYEPSELTIRKGDTVTFSTTEGRPYWPASNLHPSHMLYPAFDPKRPLESGESWSFTFENTGEWRFHDHLYPYYTGIIRVQ